MFRLSLQTSSSQTQARPRKIINSITTRSTSSTQWTMTRAHQKAVQPRIKPVDLHRTCTPLKRKKIPDSQANHTSKMMETTTRRVSMIKKSSKTRKARKRTLMSLKSTPRSRKVSLRRLPFKASLSRRIKTLRKIQTTNLTKTSDVFRG
jgi:hypothetical protein